MPPRIKVPKEDIIQAAYEITQEKGIAFVNAREVAKKLECSTQPIFSSFSTIQELKEEAKRKALEEYNSYLKEGMKEERQYKGSGKAYIRFAKEKPKLFQLIFMNDEQRKTNAILLGEESLADIKKIIQEQIGATEEEAMAFHLEIWIFTHGIATLLATRSADISDEEIDKMLTDIFIALSTKFKKEKGEKNGNSH